MYTNIGGKIKGLAKFFGYGGIFIFTLGGVALFLGFSADSNFEDLAFVVPIIAVAGCLLSWLSGFFVYGFGQLIHQYTEINKKLEKTKEEKTETI